MSIYMGGTLLVRGQARCPVCKALHCLTTSGRIWTHGPKRARCRGSQRTLSGAEVAASDIRGGAS